MISFKPLALSMYAHSMYFHSIMPMHPFGSERYFSISTIAKSDNSNKNVLPPARVIPFCIQTIARLPSLVRTLFGDTRLLQLGIRIGSNCRHIYIQFQLPLKDAFTVTDNRDAITSNSEIERSMYFWVTFVLVPISKQLLQKILFKFFRKYFKYIGYISIQKKSKYKFVENIFRI